MKTQKQLPKKFTFICDENSREQLEKLGIDLAGYQVCDIGFYYFVENNKVQRSDSDQNDYYRLINLADYLDQEQTELSGTIPASDRVITSVLSIELNGSMDIKPIKQPEPKWQEKTRGGHVDIKEIKQIGNKLAVFGLRNDVDYPNDNLVYWFCNLDGINIGDNNYFDLIPYNTLLTTLEKELEEVRSKEKQILEKIEELKTK